LIWLAALAVAAEANSTPLLDYASRFSVATAPNEAQLRRELDLAERALATNPPPAKNCATTLGAARFATLLQAVAAQRAWLADHGGAVRDFSRALACTPRAVALYAQLAEELLNAGRYDDAMATAVHGFGIAHDDYRLGSIVARLDFINERWPDAIGWLRWSAAVTPERDKVAYWECLLWLAQLRSGVAHPQPLGASQSEDWPKPILDTLQGSASEEQLLEAVREESDETKQREKLVEALYYIGEQRLAAGQTEIARRYFAATVNLKVIYYIEHDLALAELAKMRARAPPQ